MKRLIILALVAIVAFAGWRWWLASQPSLGMTAQETLAMPDNASPAEALALTQESVDALKAENDVLESRIADLEQQATDAQQLIDLKTTRLQELEGKSDAK